MNKSDEFKHRIQIRVKFHEVDILGVCNNAVYFSYFEDARLDYVKNLGLIKGVKDFFRDDSFFIMARNECDYIEPAEFDDLLNIYTKINFIGNSSFGFEHVVEKAQTQKIIARGGGVVVQISRSTGKSVPLNNEFYKKVSGFEGDVEIRRNNGGQTGEGKKG